MDGKDTEPVVKIGTEFPPLNSPGEIAVGCSNDGTVQFFRPCSTETHNFIVLVLSQCLMYKDW